MRRTAVQALRFVRQLGSRRLVLSRSPRAIPFSYAVNFRAISSRHDRALPSPLTSSMHLGRVSVAFISTLVAGGAFYAYRGMRKLRMRASQAFV